MTVPVRTQPLRAPRPAPRRGPQPAPARARRPDLRVVAAPRRRPRTPAILAVTVVLVFGSLLASAVFHSILVSGQVHLDEVNTSISTEQTDLARAKLALAEAQSPERIASAAAALGMVPAPEQHWLSPTTTTTVPVDGAAP